MEERIVRRRRWFPVLVAAVTATGGLAAAPPEGRTGTTGEAPLAEDVCPEDYGDLDPSDPVGTLYAPEPDPSRDLCATWVTAHWEGEGVDAVLERVTFGLRTLGDIELGPERGYAFSWLIPDFYEPSGLPTDDGDGSCRATLYISDGTIESPATLRTCEAPLVDYLAGASLPARVTVDGPVLEVEIRVAQTSGRLADALTNGGTLHGFCPITYLVEPWSEDAIHAGDVTFVPPEPT